MIFSDNNTNENHQGERKQPLFMNLNIGCVPMTPEAFEYNVVTYLKNIGISNEEYLSIGYEPDRNDNVSAIQAYKKENGLYYIELLMRFDDGLPFHVYTKNDLSFEETINYFKKVLLEFSCPDVTVWDDDTEFQLSQMGYEFNDELAMQEILSF